MSEGIKSYSKILDVDLADFTSGIINISPSKYDFHYVLSLYSSRYVYPLKLNVIYTFSNRSINIGYGNGISLTCIMYIDDTNSSTKLTLYYPDGSSEVFNYVNNRYESDDSYIIEDSQVYPYYLNYELHKKDGSILVFRTIDSYSSHLFYLTSKKNQNNLNCFYNYSVITNNIKKITTIENAYDEIIELSYSTTSGNILLTSATIKKNNVIVSYISFSYDSSNNLINVYCKKNGTVIEKIYDFSISSSISGSYTTLTFTNNIKSFTSSVKLLSSSGRLNTYTDKYGRTIKLVTTTAGNTITDNIKRVVTYNTYDENHFFKCSTNGRGELEFITLNDKKKIIVEQNKQLFLNPSLNGTRILENNVDGYHTTITREIDIDYPATSYESTREAYCIISTSTPTIARFNYNVVGNKEDIYAAMIWIKAKENSNVDIEIKMQFDGNDNKTLFTVPVILKKRMGVYLLYVVEGISNDSFSTVNIVFNTTSTLNHNIYVDLYKRDLANLYKYDSSGNIIESLINGRYNYYEYNEKAQIVRTYDKSLFYDTNQYINSINSNDSSIINNLIDSSGSLINSTISNGSNYLNCNNEYPTNKKEPVIASYDSKNTKMEYEYNNLNGDITLIASKSYYDQSNYLKLCYTYNDINFVTSTSYYANNSLIGTLNNTISTNQNLTTINVGTNHYNFNYDAYHRIISISFNNIIVESYTYKLIGSSKTDLIETITTGNYTKTFTYNGRNQITSISDETNNNSYNYSYDSNTNNLTSKVINNVTYTYTYNVEGNIISFSYPNLSINYYYDVDNTLTKKKYTYENQSYEEIYYSLDGNSLHRIIEELTDNYYSSFFVTKINGSTDNSLDLEYDLNYISLYNILESPTLYEKREKLDNTNIYYIEFDNTFNERLTYIVSSSSGDRTKSVTVCFTNQNNTSDEKCLLSLQDINDNTLYVTINQNGNIKLKYNDSLIYTFDTLCPYNLYDWNVITLSYSSNITTNNINVSLNGKSNSVSYNLNLFEARFLNVGAYGSTLLFYGKITGIQYINKFESIEDIDKIQYKLINQVFYYIENKDALSANSATIKKEIANTNYIYYPLSNDLNSNGNIDYITKKDKPSFIINDTNSYLILNGNNLVLENLNLNSLGFISLRCNSNIKSLNNRILFDIKDSNNEIKLYLKQDNKYYLDVDGAIQSSSLTISDISRITVTWKKTSTNNLYQFKVYSNNTQIISLQTILDASLTNPIVSIGKEIDSNNNFLGYGNNLLIGRVYLTNMSDLLVIDNNELITSSIYNGLGLPSIKNINHNISRRYFYQISNNQVYSLIDSDDYLASENISFDYVYDKQGRVIEYYENGTLNQTYEYDALGRLTKATLIDYFSETHDLVYEYEYDSFGNITKKTYDSNIKNYTYDSYGLLTRYGNEGISYSNNDGLLITSIGSKTFTYYGRRIIGVNSNITYAYDDNGLRISKIVGTDTTNFYYEGNKLIYEKKNNDIIKYIYDENDSLKGFVYNSNTYYYIFNSLGTIVGIYNSSGEIITKYVYGPFGDILQVINYNQSTIGNINHIRYKSYYYDDETHYYYLKSRYYNPEIGRFIQADEVDYLSPSNINEINLYAYCGNNPIDRWDSTGHFFISTAVLIGAIVGGIIGAATGFGITAYIDYKDDGEVFNGSVKWYDYVGASFLGGALGAAIGATVGYGIGYAAGGTYSNGLVAKTVNSGVKTFWSQTNKIHHVLSKPGHNLEGYTIKTMEKLMKKTLIKGSYAAYKSVESMVWAASRPQVTYIIIDGIIKISDMWIIGG